MQRMFAVVHTENRAAVVDGLAKKVAQPCLPQVVSGFVTPGTTDDPDIAVAGILGHVAGLDVENPGWSRFISEMLQVQPKLPVIADIKPSPHVGNIPSRGMGAKELPCLLELPVFYEEGEGPR